MAGAEEALGRTVIELNAAPDKPSDAEKLMALLQTDETWSGEIVLRRRDGTTFPAYVIYSPVHDEAGTFIGIVGVSFDITERKEAEEKQALLVRELHHRVKNTLSTVQAIMNSTARASVSMAEFQASFAGRISSLATTHSLLADDRWQAVSFSDLLYAELAPYDDGTGKRIMLDGPPGGSRVGAGGPTRHGRPRTDNQRGEARSPGRGTREVGNPLACRGRARCAEAVLGLERA